MCGAEDEVRRWVRSVYGREGKGVDRRLGGNGLSDDDSDDGDEKGGQEQRKGKGSLESGREEHEGSKDRGEDRGTRGHGKMERRGGEMGCLSKGGRGWGGEKRATQHQSFAPSDLMIVFIGKDSRREN